MRVRIAVDASGVGIDVAGVQATEIFAAAEPLTAWLRLRDPAAVVRALYIHPYTPRAIISLEPPQASESKPWVLRLEGADAAVFLSEAPNLEPAIATAVNAALDRRAAFKSLSSV